jgi:GNAT superfamily N-acetyltransferase
MIILNEVRSLEEMLPAYDLIKQLTPTLTPDVYKAYLNEMLPHRYSQLLAYSGNDLLGVSGYWIGVKIYCGRYLEIDNFIVSEQARNNGIGKLMHSRLEEIARIHDCNAMMLDAYVQNQKAHAFYIRERYAITGFHFMKNLKSDVKFCDNVSTL